MTSSIFTLQCLQNGKQSPPANVSRQGLTNKSLQKRCVFSKLICSKYLYYAAVSVYVYGKPDSNLKPARYSAHMLFRVHGARVEGGSFQTRRFVYCPCCGNPSAYTKKLSSPLAARSASILVCGLILRVPRHKYCSGLFRRLCSLCLPEGSVRLANYFARFPLRLWLQGEALLSLLKNAWHVSPRLWRSQPHMMTAQGPYAKFF